MGVGLEWPPNQSQNQINIWFVFGIQIVTPLVVSWKFYKYNQSYECWIKKKSLIWEQIWVDCQNIQEILFEADGLRLDQVSGAKRWNIKWGKSSSTFFSKETVESIPSRYLPAQS